MLAIPTTRENSDGKEMIRTVTNIAFWYLFIEFRQRFYHRRKFRLAIWTAYRRRSGAPLHIRYLREANGGQADNRRGGGTYEQHEDRADVAVALVVHVAND